MNEMLRFMLKPDARTHAQTDAQTDTYMEGIYNLSSRAFAFNGLSLQSEATAPIIREK